MKRTIIVLVALIIIIACATIIYKTVTVKTESDIITTQQALKEKAADFTVTDAEGNPVKLSDITDKPVVVNIWATWCDPCKDELPVFEKMYGEYKDRVNFMMINFTDGNDETVEKVNAFIKENGYTFPIYFDSALSAIQAYGVNTIPRTLFIDKEGTLVYNHIGEIDEATFIGYLKEVLSEK